MSQIMKNFDWCAAVFRQGVTAQQIVARFPQFDAGVDGCVLMNEEPTPTALDTLVWLDTLRHEWKANGGTQTGSVSCSKCGAWSMTNTPAFGCEVKPEPEDDLIECPACKEIALREMERVQSIDHNENETIITEYECDKCHTYLTM